MAEMSSKQKWTKIQIAITTSNYSDRQIGRIWWHHKEKFKFIQTPKSKNDKNITYRPSESKITMIITFSVDKLWISIDD